MKVPGAEQYLLSSTFMTDLLAQVADTGVKEYGPIHAEMFKGFSAEEKRMDSVKDFLELQAGKNITTQMLKDKLELAKRRIETHE